MYLMHSLSVFSDLIHAILKSIQDILLNVKANHHCRSVLTECINSYKLLQSVHSFK